MKRSPVQLFIQARLAPLPQFFCFIFFFNSIFSVHAQEPAREEHKSRETVDWAKAWVFQFSTGYNIISERREIKKVFRKQGYDNSFTNIYGEKKSYPFSSEYPNGSFNVSYLVNSKTGAGIRVGWATLGEAHGYQAVQGYYGFADLAYYTIYVAPYMIINHKRFFARVGPALANHTISNDDYEYTPKSKIQGGLIAGVSVKIFTFPPVGMTFDVDYSYLGKTIVDAFPPNSINTVPFQPYYIYCNNFSMGLSFILIND